MAEANLRRIPKLLLGPSVLALVLANCTTDSGSAGTAGSNSAGGSPGVAGSTAKAGGDALGGANPGSGGASAGLAGLPSVGGGGVATGGSAGSATGGSTSGGGTNLAGAAGTGAGAGAGPTGVAVKLDSPKQVMDGFGINNTWATAMTAGDADAMFNTTGNGLGLSILRVGMNSAGAFMSENIENDIKLAKARGVQTIIGSCWSPPSDWKTGQNGGGNPPNPENGGGHMLPSRYEDWATRIAKFAKDKGLYAMSIGNEPDFASCGTVEPCNGDYPTTLYTADEMVAFMKIAGPKLKAAGVKVIAPEASEWIHTWSNTSATGSWPSMKNSSNPLQCGFPATKCAAGKGYDYGHALFADKTAWAAFDIMGVHQYDTQVAEPWPADVPDTKPVWQTEMSGVKWWPEDGPSSDINNGIAVAGWIHNAITVGYASAWLWWWWNAYNTPDNEGLRLGKEGTTDTKRRYTLGNYSRFIRPGYTRVDISGSIPADVLLTAYKGPDGSVVVVAINKGSAAVNVPIAISGGAAPATLTPWVTSANDNLKAATTTVPVTSGSFLAALASKTVTTFVGK